MITDDAERRILRVHLIGYVSPPACTPANNRPYVIPPLVEDPPMYEAEITLRRPIKAVRSFDPKTSLRLEKGLVAATIRDIHEVIAIEY